MNVWMIVAAVLAVGCTAMALVCVQLNNRLKQRDRNTEDADALRRELRAARGEDVRRRREIAALRRALEEEQEHADALADDLESARDRMQEMQKLAEQADARRIRTEKDVYAARMRADLLEKQIAQLNQEQINQEQLYQDILRDRDIQIARLQENQPKRKPRKKPDVLDQQVSLDDLLGGM